MRAVKDLPQVQIVLNQLLDYQNKDSTRARNQKGNQIKKLGAGTDPDDAVTMAQIANLAPQASVPQTAQVDHFYAIPWSIDSSPIPGSIVPPYAIVNDDRVGQPTAMWIVAGNISSATGPLKVNIKINANNGNTGTIIFTSDLSLPANQNGPVYQSNFITPIPYFGLGTYIQPIITASNGQLAVTIGITIKKVRMAGLS